MTADGGNGRLGEFFAAEKGMLCGYLQSKGASFHDAEDILGESFIVMCRNWSKIQDGCQRSYLYRVATNLLYGKLSESNKICLPPSLGPEVTLQFEQQVIDHETLIQALKEVTYREWQAVQLLYWVDLSCAESAEIMGVTAGAVKRYAFDARRKIKLYLGEGGDDDLKREEFDG